MIRIRSGLVALALVAPLAGAQQQRSDRDFRWDGQVSEGRWVYVRNLNGEVRVERGSGSRVEVTAEKRWRRGNPDDVTIEVTRIGSGDRDILVCAIWRDVTRECDENGYRTYDGSSRNRNDRWERERNDVAVDIVIRLPAGVRLDASSVNGALDISGATVEVEAHTVNGGIRASSSGGPIRANTVNGDIDIQMARLGDEDLRFHTVNGSIEVTVPDGLNADVTMSTVNGRVGSDFPMTLNGRINPRRINATIGRGGPRLEFTTVNGSIDLRRGSGRSER
jgi:hypothetical protein